MSSTTSTSTALGVLSRQEVRNYLGHKLFWFSAALTLLLCILQLLGNSDTDGESSTLYMIGPAALLGVLGLVTMFGLTRRSDRAAESAGAVAVPERTRTLALASATVVPLALALACFGTAIVEFHLHPPADHTVWSATSSAYVYATQFGAGVVPAIGGPLLGLLLARHLPRRGVAAVASVVLVLITILMQGMLEGGQPYRVLWFWTYFHGPYGPDGDSWARLPGNPFLWIGYLLVLCALGLVVALRHDPESDRTGLTRAAVGLTVLAIVLGALTMTVGYSEVLTNPVPLPDGAF